MTDAVNTTAPAKNLARYLLLAASLLLILSLGTKLWRVGSAVRGLQTAPAAAELLLANGPTNIDPTAAADLVYGLREDVVTLRDELAFVLPLTPYLGWVPRYGPTLTAAPILLEMADAGTETAAYAFRGLQPALVILQGDGSTFDQLPGILAVINAAEPDLRQAAISLERLAAARSQLTAEENLAWRIRSLLPQLDAWLPIGQDSLQLALVLPEIMGIDGPRSYLLLAQNEDELRPTGGFITGAGLVRVENGRLVGIDFEDTYAVDNYLEKPYELAPDILQNIMGLDLFFFRDANFWPDFPTSAQEVAYLYSYGKDVPLPDGVIAIDQQFVQMLVAATGPVSIPGEDVEVTAANVIDTFRQAWAPNPGTEVRDWVANRKDFLPVFAQGFMNKLTGDIREIDPVLLVENVFAAAAGKHFQLYMRNQAEAAVLQAIGWDGRLPTTLTGDFLMVVDTNVGYSKANLLVDQEIHHEVTLDAIGTAVATTTIQYTNNAAANDEPCAPGIGYDTDPTYLEMAENCHYTYLRLYTPAASQLLNASQHPIPADFLTTQTDWNGSVRVEAEFPALNTFGNTLLVPRQSTETASFTYTIPGIVRAEANGTYTYTLSVYKQAGTRPFPTTITIYLPEGASLLLASPEPASVVNTIVTFNQPLDRDHTFAVTYQFPPGTNHNE